MPPPAQLTPLAAGLKEWAALVHGAGTGRVTALLRRGGVREAGFSLRSPAAALIPTSFHQGGPRLGASLTPALLAATPPALLAFDQRAADPLPLATGAAFTAAWRIDGETEAALGALATALAPHTGLGPAGWAGRAAGALSFTLLELRAAPLVGLGGPGTPGASPPPALAQATPGLWGCRSWVDLPPADAGAGAGAGAPSAFALDLTRPALAGAAWEAAAAGLRAVLDAEVLPPGVTVTEMDLGSVRRV